MGSLCQEKVEIHLQDAAYVAAPKPLARGAVTAPASAGTPDILGALRAAVEMEPRRPGRIANVILRSCRVIIEFDTGFGVSAIATERRRGESREQAK